MFWFNQYTNKQRSQAFYLLFFSSQNATVTAIRTNAILIQQSTRPQEIEAVEFAMIVNTTQLDDNASCVNHYSTETRSKTSLIRKSVYVCITTILHLNMLVQFVRKLNLFDVKNKEILMMFFCRMLTSLLR